MKTRQFAQFFCLEYLFQPVFLCGVFLIRFILLLKLEIDALIPLLLSDFGQDCEKRNTRRLQFCVMGKPPSINDEEIQTLMD